MGYISGCICPLFDGFLREVVAQRRRRNRVVPNNHCILCLTGMETRDHLFFNCLFSNYIWALCRLKLGLVGQAKSSFLEEVHLLHNNSEVETRQQHLPGLCFELQYGTFGKKGTQECFSNKTPIKLWGLEGFMKMCTFCLSFAVGQLTRMITS